MKYRIRLDLSFDSQFDAESLMVYAKKASNRAVSLNLGKSNEEIAFIDFEICRHDEGLPCTRLERVEKR